MALFRKRAPKVVRVSANGRVEERKTLSVRGSKVEVRRIEEAPAKPKKQRASRTSKTARAPKPKNGIATSRVSARRPVDDEIIVPVESARKQMLVSVNGNQTQIVILEGPVLVEHYVAREDSGSVAGNIYLAVVRNVLPGM